MEFMELIQLGNVIGYFKAEIHKLFHKCIKSSFDGIKSVENQ